MENAPGTWSTRTIRFKYSVSYLKLFELAFRGQVCVHSFPPGNGERVAPDGLAGRLEPGLDFAAIHGLPVEQALPPLRATRDGILYAANQTRNYFIDMGDGWEAYLRSLNAKTRATAQRKVRKLAEADGGTAEFRVYRSPEEIAEYHALARQVARKTYQEKLFHGAIPATSEFLAEAQRQAAEGQVRGFLLFHGGRPVAYLHVPLREGIAGYAYLGYDPDHAALSPGAVLLYLALESLFGEGGLRYFDFESGENQAKSSMSNGSFLRADVYLFRDNARNRCALYGWRGLNAFSEGAGRALDALGLRRFVKRVLRSV